MKKIDWLIIRSFLGPLAVTFSLAVFVLLMQFLWKYIDDLVGKGLDLWVIVQLLFYASAVSVPMALPIATLFASIMTMGNFGEKYELVAMKAAGLSLKRIMSPLTILAACISVLAFLSSNYAMPYAELKYRTLLYDVTKKKPALNIKPNEFYSGIDNYIIRIQEKGKDGKTLKGVLVYDHSEQTGNNNVTYAKNGIMYTTKDNRYLYLTLYDGYNYTESVQGKDYLNRPLTRLYFKEQTKRFDLSSFAFTKTNEEEHKAHYKMLNVSQLLEIEDTLARNLDLQKNILSEMLFSKLFNYNSFVKDSLSLPQDTSINFYQDIQNLSEKDLDVITSLALSNVRNANEEINYNDYFIRNDAEYLRKHYVERHKKFTLSIACFLLFLIGAPFGSIVRKGGLGVPLVSSVLIFVIYYIISMVGEKSVREGAMNVWFGMWMSTYILLSLGIFLTLKATSDSPLFDIETWEKRWNNLFKKKEKKVHHEDSSAM